MKISKILMIVCLQLFGFKALAMSQGIFGGGDIEVVKSFTVKGVDAQTGRGNGEKLTIAPGKFIMNLSSSRQEVFRGACPLFIGCIGKKVDVQSMVISIGKPGSQFKEISFIAPSTLLKDETLAFYAKDSKQSFNVFMKRSSSDRNENYRTEVQECSVKKYCTEGGGGLLYGHQAYCTYAMGTQKVRLYDVITTRRMQVKITGLKNELLATFKGSSETEDTEVESTGECVLNID